MILSKIQAIATGARSSYRFVRHASSDKQLLTNVYVLDPAILMETFKNDTKTMVQIQINTNFLPLLRKGEFELGEFDDPMNSWHFGKKAEIFQYKFLGSHKVISGWSGIISEPVLQQWKSNIEVMPNMKLEQLNKYLDEIHSYQNSPLIFAGRVVDCSQASVYKLESSGETQGIMIQSDFEYGED